MQEKRKPQGRIVLKAKEPDTKPGYVRLLTVWPANKSGHLGYTFERAYADRAGVAFIELTDGTRLKPEAYWVNEESADNGRREAKQEELPDADADLLPAIPAHDDSDIPF